MAEDSGYLGICTVVVRKGKIRGTKTHIIKKGYYQSIDRVYESALINFYSINPDIPKKILTTNKVLSNDITLLIGSLAAAQSVETIGNKYTISKTTIFKNLESILK